MSSDLHSIYKDIVKYLGYLGIPDVTSRFAWKKVKSGESLFAVNSKEPAVLTLVGRVSDDRFAVGPSGNYRAYGGTYPPFQPSKYTFSVKEPNQDDDPFAGDWGVGWDNILKLQASISKLPLRRNLLESGEVRLSAPVLEKMDVRYTAASDVNEDADYGGSYPKPQEDVSSTSSTDADVLDHSLTLEWPIDPEFQEAFDKVKYTHAVQPLPVYRNGKYIEPLFVPGAMRDALVMVSFSVMHYRIQKNDDKTPPHESFTGRVVDIVVLKMGGPGVPSPLKRKNIRDGPLQQVYAPAAPAPVAPAEPSVATTSAPNPLTLVTNAAPNVTPAAPSRKRAKN